MRVKFFGTRGSIPVCSPEYQGFGGNTTCILIKGSERTAILDAGTGIRELGKVIAADPHVGIDRPCFLMFTHFHWDHIQGLPFFSPAYDGRRKFIISAIGRDRYGNDIQSIFETQMRTDYFPVPMTGMGAGIEFLKWPEDSLSDGGASLHVLKHCHPGDAYSYRIQGKEQKVVVVCTDIEHGDRVDERIVEFARGADLLIHEGQYTTEELPRFRGWGHSSWQQAVEVAERAEVKQLIVTHHDPDHDDAFLQDVERQCQARLPNALLAREGMAVEL